MKNINKYITIIGSPKIFSYTVMWLIVLVFIGTVVQKDIGLYAAQMDYFSSWFKWIGFIHLPSGKITMPIECSLIYHAIFLDQIFLIKIKFGITITHSGVILMLLGGGLTSYFSLRRKHCN